MSGFVGKMRRNGRITDTLSTTDYRNVEALTSRNLKEHEDLRNLLDFVVVIPTRNEAWSIGDTIDDLRRSLEGQNYSILVIDGKSEDGTAEIALSKSVKVIHQKRLGYGDALRTGFLYVRHRMKSKVIVMMDADATYDPEDIPRLVYPIINDQSDMVVGNRLLQVDAGSMPRMNRIGNRVLSGVARLTIGVPIHDTQCGLRAFATRLVDYLSLTAEGMPVAIEMIVDAQNAGASITEVPIRYRRRKGTSKLNPFRDGLRILGTILRLVRDTRPLLFFTSAASILGALGLYLGADVALEWLQTHTVQRLPTLILTGILLMASIQLFALALVADMLKRSRQTRRRFL